ncbi:MAG: hypothetical protein HPY44_18880 [Armatimonadetes bacterium]|nr:hypothetical protein [Armatimonadota bacterium]
MTRREEQDISDLILGEDSSPVVRDAILADGRFMDLLISEWLLRRRLDLPTAWRCEFARSRAAFGVCRHLHWPWLLGATVVLALLAWLLPVAALFLAVAWGILVVLSPKFGRVWAPRLLASVMIGWLALSTTGWAWEFAAEQRHATCCAITDALLVCAGLWYVLFGEVGRHISLGESTVERRELTRRAGVIWLVGALHALSAGLLGITLVGCVTDTVTGNHLLAPLVSSSVTILKLSPFALTIGLLTQTLWERDAVTEPL